MLSLLLFTAFFIFLESPAMDRRSDLISVALIAPEFWIERDNRWIQYDIDEDGNHCELGPRHLLLEKDYLKVFPKLEHYLKKNRDKHTQELRFIGFEPKDYDLLKNCLRLGYLYQTALDINEKNDLKKIAKKWLKEECSDTQTLNVFYHARLVGISWLAECARENFKSRELFDCGQMRPLVPDDIYEGAQNFEDLENNSDFFEENDSDSDFPINNLNQADLGLIDQILLRVYSFINKKKFPTHVEAKKKYEIDSSVPTLTNQNYQLALAPSRFTLKQLLKLGNHSKSSPRLFEDKEQPAKGFAWWAKLKSFFAYILWK